jgi:molecular chaperone DnaK
LVKEGKLNGWQDIHQVLLVGGSSRMPQVSQMMQQLSGLEPKLYEPDLAVAKGAALYAVIKLAIEYEKSGDSRGIDDFDIDAISQIGKTIVETVCSFAVGLKCLVDATGNEYENAVLIERNSFLPATMTRTFKTAIDNQPAIRLVVLEGDAPDPEDCLVLGEGLIQGIPPGLPAGSLVDVTFELTSESLIRVTVIETTHYTRCSFELQREGKSSIDIQRAKEDIALISVG